jgi:hypothetical protein
MHQRTRKVKIRAAVTQLLKLRLGQLFGPEDAQPRLWSINQAAVAIKLQIQRGPSGWDSLLKDRVEAITRPGYGMIYMLDMAHRQDICVVWSAGELMAHRAGHAKMVKKIEEEEQRAREVLSKYLVRSEKL